MRGLGLQAASFQIVARLAAGAGAVELLFKELRRQLDNLVERLLAAFAGFVFRRPFGQLDPGFACQPLDGFGKGQPFGLGQPFEGVPTRAAAEAMVVPALRLDLEGGRFLYQ